MPIANGREKKILIFNSNMDHNQDTSAKLIWTTMSEVALPRVNYVTY